MFKQFALSFREHMEQYQSSILCLDSIPVRSYKTKQIECMIS